MKHNSRPTQIDVSYELYKELAGEICTPINDPHLTIELRYELYTSKLIYLYNLQEQCFRIINLEKINTSYTQKDLILIQNAIEVTKEFLRQTLREHVSESVEIAQKKFVYGSPFLGKIK
jgi:hypothetical protein